MSVNKVNKTTGDLSLLAGANNITNTTGVAELSALANIGTSANATQHDVNVAIDSKIEDIKTVHISQLPSGSPSNFDKCDFTYIKRGRIVTILGYIHATDAESGRIYFNLPAIKSNNIAPLASVNTTNGDILDCEIEQNYMYLRTLSAGNCRFSGTYITES